MEDPKIFKKLDELFNSKELSMEKMEEFAHETIKFFESLKDSFLSGNEDKKKQSLEMAEKMQRKLQAYAQATYEKLGLNEDAIKELIDPSNFTEEEWKSLQKTEKELHDFQHSIHKMPSKKASEEKKHTKSVHKNRRIS